MRTLTPISIAFSALLFLGGSSLLAQTSQTCHFECAGQCLRNTSTTTRADGYSVANLPPLEALSANGNLAAKLQSLLPAGENVKEAASGFKRFGQFAAVVHLSSNLGIPFDQLKSKLLGKGKESLTKAIQELNPQVNARAELKKVNEQMGSDLGEPTGVAIS